MSVPITVIWCGICVLTGAAVMFSGLDINDAKQAIIGGMLAISAVLLFARTVDD